MTPWKLAIAGLICFALFLGALQSEGRLDNDPQTTGDPNMLGAILGIAAPVLLIAAVVWAIARRVNGKPKGARSGGSEPEPSPDSHRPSKTCPDCAEQVLAAARVCRHCGYRFFPPRAA